MPKIKLEVEGMDELVNRIKKLDGDVETVAEKALKECHEYVTPQLHEIMKPHEQTGITEASIRDQAKVEWTGRVAEIKVGFDIANGGLPSIFLTHGTPRMKKDQKLYNLFYSKSNKIKLKEIQEDVFYNAIRKLGG